MRRQTILDVGLGVLVIGFGILILVQWRHRAQAQSGPGNLNLPPLPKERIAYPGVPERQAQGVPAVHPTRPNEVPAFTPDDVRKFFTSTLGASGGRGKHKARIRRIDCNLTAGKVIPMLEGRNAHLPDDLPVCYVEVHGTFTYYGPASPRSPRGTSSTYHNAFLVFDARTGNIILSGGLERPTSQ